MVDCGKLATVEDTVLLSVTGTTYSSVATFVCEDGFIWRSGGNSSVCGADGVWKGPNMVCEGNKSQIFSAASVQHISSCLFSLLFGFS